MQTDKTADALKEFFNELTGILKPIPGDELDKAKNYVALGFPAEFESTGDLAQKMEEQVVHSLPDEYFPELHQVGRAGDRTWRRKGRDAVHSARQVRGRDRRRSSK